jgi:hypothetical protein
LRHEMLSHEQLFTCRIFCRANNYLLVAFFVARTNIYLSNFLSREEICFFLFSSWKNDFLQDNISSRTNVYFVARQHFVARQIFNYESSKFWLLVTGFPAFSRWNILKWGKSNKWP